MIQPILRPVIKAANDRLRGGSPIVLPEPPLLDLDFVGRPSLTYPGLPAITFARADATTCATYRDGSGTRRTAVANEPRFDHDVNGNPLGLLIERQNTNYLLNSLSPATQTTGSLSTGTYTLSCEGSGSAEVEANTATGSGFGTATEGSPVTFTLSGAGTVDVTVTGTLTAFQLENFNNVSSLIVTGGATATRSADQASMDVAAFGFNPLRGTLVTEAHHPQATSVAAQVHCAIDDGTNNTRIVVFRGAGLTIDGGCRVWLTTSSTHKFQADTSFAIAGGAVAKIATSYKSGATVAVVNGQILTPTINDAFALSGITTLRLGSQVPFGSASLQGHMRRLRYYPLDLPGAVLQSLTA